MQLDDALIQIADIRQRMARAGTFRGYPSAPTAVSGVLALVAAAVQVRWIPAPRQAIDAYVELWGAVAIVSLVICGIAMLIRLWRLGSTVQRSLSVSAIQQIVPSLIAGAMASSVILYVDPAVLPGIWMMFFGLGIFASRPLLPRPIGWMGAYYLLAGMYALSGQSDPLGPWMMGLTFGIGQIAIAAMLYWTLERGKSIQSDESGDA
ncbi:MAG TPA: hypothetical protein VHY37_04745 [Tepidisphaeraceae bacterium]|jgi:hypothetical protein|nr:hypothetical protein [Tepidisphaeraceae bacterium]